ncbi:MAG TPA: hypothetical protein VFQ35_26430 [Polyangiaceae bacterium]|nr:hypothetical protein [Polyangiaceae bacterium]
MPRRLFELFVLGVASLQACSLLAPSDEELLGGGRGSAGAGGASSGGKASVAGAGGAATGGKAGAEGGRSGSGGAGGTSASGADAGGAAGFFGGAGASGAGEEPCSSGRHRCENACVSNSAVESCGAACTPCPTPHNGHATCDGNACGVSCDVGFTACGLLCADLRTDHENCGGCGSDFVCSADEVCQAGSCVSVSGCSDGTREGFAVAGSYLNIAGCAARWPLGSMRAEKTGIPCGEGLADCAVPADACGPGWHVCAAPPYGPAEVRTRATVAECLAQPGAYAAAVGDQACDPCSPDDTGAGAACCGRNCVQQNGSCIYPGMTAWFGVINGHTNVCGDIESNSSVRGVLCCLDL